MLSDSEPQICIQDLGAYNEGRHIFKWVNIDEDEIEEAIKTVREKALKSCELAQKGLCLHEEMMVADTNNIPFIGEGIQEYLDYTEKINELKNFPIEAVETWIDHVGLEYITTEHFQDAYIGTYKDQKDFAYQEMEEREIDPSGIEPEYWSDYHYFNGGEYWSHEGNEFHVFRHI